MVGPSVAKNRTTPTLLCRGSDELLCHRVGGEELTFNRVVAVPQMLGMIPGTVSVALVAKCTGGNVRTCMCRH